MFVSGFYYLFNTLALHNELDLFGINGLALHEYAHHDVQLILIFFQQLVCRIVTLVDNLRDRRVDFGRRVV